MLDPQLRTLIDPHKPKAFYRQTEVKNFGEREKLQLEDREIYVYNFEWIISSAGVDYDDEFMCPETTLPQFAIDAEKGVPIQVNHDYGSLNCGRSTSGRFDSEKEIVIAGGYIQEGLTDVDSDSVIARLLAGTSPEASVGYLGERVCSFDGTPMHWLFGDCQYGHTRGQEIRLDADGNEVQDAEKAVKTATIYGKIINGRLLEFSPVWRACNPDTQLIKGVKSLYKSGQIGDIEVKSLSDRTLYDFKSIVGGKKRTFTPKTVSQGRVDMEEYSAVVNELQELNHRIEELEKRPNPKEVEAQIDSLNTELEAKDAEMIQLTSELETAQQTAEDLNFGLKLLRQDVLDAYATEQGITEKGREYDEGYKELDKDLRVVESIGKLIRLRKQYSQPDANLNGGKPTRRYRGVDSDKDTEINRVPVPGTPGSGAYSE